MRDRVLLVEDDPNDEALTRRALARAGVQAELVVARDGREALDYLHATGAHAGRDPGPQPRLVLLDLKLPRVDGLEVLRRLRSEETTRLLPVVVLTSSLDPRDVQQCYLLGANAYVRKPVDFGEFAEVVALLGRHWLGLNVPPPFPGLRGEAP